MYSVDLETFKCRSTSRNIKFRWCTLPTLFLTTPQNVRNENYGKKPCAEKTLCSFQKQHYAVGSLLLHRPVPGVWRRGHNSPGPESLWAPNDYGWLQNVATMSQVLSSIQYICFRETLGSNMGAPNFLLAPGAIQHRYAHDLYVFSTNGQPLGLRSLYSTQREMRSNLSNYERTTHSPKNAEPGKNATRQSLEAWSAIKGKRRWTMRKQRHATIPRTFTKHMVKILLCVH